MTTALRDSAFSGRATAQQVPWRQRSRDLRLDFLRGLCLVKMVFSHGLPTPLHGPLARMGFVSAAEGFFFISGTVLGIVYRSRLPRDGLLAATHRLLRRALLLWAVNSALVILYSAWDFAGRKWGFFHLGRTYDWVFWGDWHWYSLLSFDQPYFLQILPRYAVLLALSPLALWLLARGRWWAVLAASWAIYLAEQVPGIDLVIPFLEHGRAETGFRHSAWQAVFFTGMVVGYERDRLGWLWHRLTKPRVLLLLAAIACAGVIMQGALASEWIAVAARWENKLFARDVIGIGRIPNLVAVFVLAFWIVTVLWESLNRALGWLLLPLGQNALLAFVMHIPLTHAAIVASELGLLGASSRWNPLHLAANLLIAALVWATSVALLARRGALRPPPAPEGLATSNQQAGS